MIYASYFAVDARNGMSHESGGGTADAEELAELLCVLNVPGAPPLVLKDNVLQFKDYSSVSMCLRSVYVSSVSMYLQCLCRQYLYVFSVYPMLPGLAVPCVIFMCLTIRTVLHCHHHVPLGQVGM